MSERVERILLYGFNREDQRLLKFLFASNYDVEDVSECFTDILAIPAVAVFINPVSMSESEFDMMNEVFEGSDTIMVVFSEKPHYETTFRYHVMNLKDDKDIKLRMIYSHLKERKIHLDVRFDYEFLEHVILLQEEVGGIDQYSDELIRIDALYVENGKIKDEYHSWMKPRFPLCKKISEMIGVTNEDLKQYPEIATVMNEFSEWHKESTLLVWREDVIYPYYDRAYREIGKNMSEKIFDLRKIQKELFPNINFPRLSDFVGYGEIKEDDDSLIKMYKLFHEIYKEVTMENYKDFFN